MIFNELLSGYFLFFTFLVDGLIGHLLGLLASWIRCSCLAMITLCLFFFYHFTFELAKLTGSE